ncbi:MAG: substrate-binding domain-containing protein [Patescibacteria group bacterium]
MNKKLLTGLIVTLLAIVGIISFYFYRSGSESTPATTKSPEKEILIGFSLGTLQEERWQRDRDEFLKRAEAVGAVVDLQSSNNNAEKQISQIESMIVKGVDALVIVAYDAESLTDVVEKAHQAGIKVISYDRLIKNAAVDLYLSFDNEKVGEYQAQYVLQAVEDKINRGEKVKVAYIGGSATDNNAFLLKAGSFKLLQPKIDSGEIEIVLDKFSDGWNPENAYKNLKGYLEESDGAVDAVVAANDGTAFGAIRALEEYGLAGKIPVSGQDAELSAIQRIIQGTQTVTVYKPIYELASTGVDLAVSLAKGQNIPTDKTVNNGKFDVPSVLLESVPVTKENIESTVIKDGFYTLEDLKK